MFDKYRALLFPPVRFRKYIRNSFNSHKFKIYNFSYLSSIYMI